MKRKLCVAMALIGNSKVILLDEPTAGMDPEARHDVVELLSKEKANRAVLLTTHYMDEADLLGDRISIMVKGQLACNGTPLFLKDKFGTGYVLTIVLELNCQNNTYQNMNDYFQAMIYNILMVVQKYIKNARVDTSNAPEFSIILPVNCKKFFADLFEELENSKENLYIKSFGLSFNTLEQVFLKVGELAENQDLNTNEESEKNAKLCSRFI